MKKITYPKVDLRCVLQQVDTIAESQCLTGIISRQSGGKFRFEEAIRKGRAPRNPKLYDGKYVTMVRMRNGRYQLHMKTMSNGFDREKLPLAIYMEVSAALQILE